METAFQQLDLMPNEQSTDPGLLKLESQFLDICSCSNLVDSALYLVPIFYNGQVFVRYMEKGMFKGFTSKFRSVLSAHFKIPVQKIVYWMVYTDKDFKEQSTRKYSGKNQVSRGYEQMMYRNKTSVGELVSSLRSKLDHLKSVIYVQKNNARPTHPEDR